MARNTPLYLLTHRPLHLLECIPHGYDEYGKFGDLPVFSFHSFGSPARTSRSPGFVHAEARLGGQLASLVAIVQIRAEVFNIEEEFRRAVEELMTDDFVTAWTSSWMMSIWVPATTSVLSTWGAGSWATTLVTTTGTGWGTGNGGWNTTGTGWGMGNPWVAAPAVPPRPRCTLQSFRLRPGRKNIGRTFRGAPLLLYPEPTLLDLAEYAFACHCGRRPPRRRRLVSYT
ncbi:hypothetical protein FB451DRAFT_1412197 [Mycena latifolia]|nr:hypothetical protein FB451DRAFT_1412197 [Mycena latifolia]